jgi:hypothetical protein
LGSELGSEFEFDRANNGNAQLFDKLSIANDMEAKASGDTSNTFNAYDDSEDHPALVALRRILDESDCYLTLNSPSGTYRPVNEKALSRRENALIRMASMNEMDTASPSPCDQKPTPKQSLLVFALLELWIYLQFAIILCFFLYTIAKRGPRDVMGLPPRRR